MFSLIRLQGKLNNAVETLEYFTGTHLEFTTNNYLMLMNEMNEEDNNVKKSKLLIIGCSKINYFS